MKISKRMTALFAAVLMMVTMLSSVPAYAAPSKSSNFSVGGKTVTGSLDVCTGSGCLVMTKTNTTMILSLSVTGMHVDANGKNPKNKGKNWGTQTTKQMGAKAFGAPGSGRHFIRFTSLHGGRYNNAENAIALHVALD